MTIAQRMNIEGFLDASTSTMSYLLIDSPTGHCAIIDSVLEFDPRSGRTHTAGADRLIARVRELRLTVDWLLESHVHADHLSAAPYLQQHLGGKVAIGAGSRKVQGVFGALFNAGAEFAPDGSQFDKLLADGEAFSIGGLSAQAIHTPGHTPACMTYLVTDGTEAAAFVGDTLFMPDYGTARCDFPGGDARTLFRSIARLLALPPNTASTCATTTSRVAASSSTSAPWPSSAQRTSTCGTASAKTNSSRCARRATPPCRCPR